MTQEITIIVDSITGGFRITATPVSGPMREGYCAKANQIAQRIKELVAPVFAEKKKQFLTKPAPASEPKRA